MEEAFSLQTCFRPGWVPNLPHLLLGCSQLAFQHCFFNACHKTILDLLTIHFSVLPGPAPIPVYLAITVKIHQIACYTLHNVVFIQQGLKNLKRALALLSHQLSKNTPGHMGLFFKGFAQLPYQSVVVGGSSYLSRAGGDEVSDMSNVISSPQSVILYALF